MTKNDLLIRRETPEDYHQTEMLVREAFWNVYHPGCNEHYILHCYRSKKDFIPELDLVLEKDGQLIGQIMYVHSEIKTDKGVMIPIVTFGPLSIHPNFSRRGYGKYLLDNSIKKSGRTRSRCHCHHRKSVILRQIRICRWKIQRHPLCKRSRSRVFPNKRTETGLFA